MSPTFVVVPQWQGSLSSRAMRLADGAGAIRGDLPQSATQVVDVPIEAGDAQDSGIHRFSTLLLVRERMELALRSASDWALTIGGDNGVSLAAVGHAARKHPDDVALVWFDAHAALHTAESSPSGAFNGMVVRSIGGEGVDGLALVGDSRVSLDRVVIAGGRDFDPAEAALITDRGIRTLAVDELGDVELLLEAVRATGAGQVYVHIDLDVLDPSVITGLGDIYPFGLAVESLTALITALRANFGLAGATLAGFAPASPAAANDDLPSILRIIGALTR